MKSPNTKFGLRRSETNKHWFRSGAVATLTAISVAAPLNIHAQEPDTINALVDAYTECSEPNYPAQPGEVFIAGVASNLEDYTIEVRHSYDGAQYESGWANINPDFTTLLPTIRTFMTEIPDTEVVFYGRSASDAEQIIGRVIVDAVNCNEGEPLPSTTVTANIDCFRDEVTNEPVPGANVRVAAQVDNESGETLEAQVTIPNIGDSSWTTVPSATNSVTAVIADTNLAQTDDMQVTVMLRRQGEFYTEQAGTFDLPAARCGANGVEYLDPAGPGTGGQDVTAYFQRTYGPSRYETAANVAIEFNPNGNTTAILASGDNPADSQTFTPYAHILGNAPILLSPQSFDGVHSASMAAIEQLGVKDIIIAGGRAAIPASTEADLIEAGYNVTRIGGVNRFDTARLVAQEITSHPNAQVDGVTLVDGGTFQDAIVGSHYSGAINNSDNPIVLTASDTNGNPRIPIESQQALQSNDDFETVTGVGGIALNRDLMEQASLLARAQQIVELTAISSEDYLATSIITAEQQLDSNQQDLRNIYAVSGDKFPDGLSAGAGILPNLAVDDLTYGDVLVIVREGDNLQQFANFVESRKVELKDNPETEQVEQITLHFVGGPASLSYDLAQEMYAIVNGAKTNQPIFPRDD